MVAYSFKKQFVPDIILDLKRQTVRAHRKRHARPGEPIQLYQGMRTPQCRKITADPICKSVEPIRIYVHWSEGIQAIKINEIPLRRSEMVEFAKKDGFPGLDEMSVFWMVEHGHGWFAGVLIKW